VKIFSNLVLELICIFLLFIGIIGYLGMGFKRVAITCIILLKNSRLDRTYPVVFFTSHRRGFHVNSCCALLVTAV